MSIEESEKHLRQILHDMRLKHEQEAKPIIDQLVRLERLKPPRPFFVANVDAEYFKSFFLGKS